MMRGLTQDVEISTVGVGVQIENRPTPATTVIGVICSGDLATHRDTIKQALKRGIEQRENAVWVCIEPKSDRLTHDLMISLDIEPVVLPLNDEWRQKADKLEGSGHVEVRGISSEGGGAVASPQEAAPPASLSYDFRRVWRDLEMLSLCDELIVFHRRSSSSPWRDRDASGLYTDKLVVVELGKPKPKEAKK